MKALESVWDALERLGGTAESMKARARLMTEVQKAVRSWEVSQSAAARRLDTSQPRLNDLLRGKIERFSLDALFDLATHAGVKVSVGFSVAGESAAVGAAERGARYIAGSERAPRRRVGARIREPQPRAPRCFVIAGPNGAGKTTFAREYLPREARTIHFVNADLIAGGLSPLEPRLAALAAGRKVLEELDRLARAREDFAFESTLSGIGYVDHLKQWRQDGYFIKIVFLQIESPELALKRIAARVRQGGHDVPRADVIRRFVRGHENFQARYKALADAWELYENSGAQPRLLEVGP
jgi:predicted ABC-type ATPase/predicted XRE-type DNA-binding protein